MTYCIIFKVHPAMVDMNPKEKLETSIFGKTFDLRKCGFETESDHDSESDFSSDEGN